MVFADWPLSLGSINPPGWLENMMPFLEHTHRLLANLVGWLVLTLFAWAYVRSWKQGLELLGLILLMATTLGFFIAAGSQRVDANLKETFLTIALGLSLLPIGWLVWSWSSRGWTLIQKLSGLALLMVVAQAILGGLRVTEISNTYAVAHGCFAQCFFCVLILIGLVADEGWPKGGFSGSRSLIWRSRIYGVLLVLLVFAQLIFGASMRHFHRHALVDDGLILTQGRWIPSFDDPMIMVLFLHKLTAFLVLFFLVGMLLRLGGGRSNPVLSRWKTPKSHVIRLLALVGVQITLGLMVIGTGKSFWVTNVHVLNGLLILGFAFVFVVRAMTGRADETVLANSPDCV